MGLRWSFHFLALMLLVLTGPEGRSDDADDLRSAVALQKVMQKAIADIEPSIACLLVSRSELYARFVSRPGPAERGKLGDFNPDTHLQGLSEDERLKLRKKLDLAFAGIVPESFGSGVVVDPEGLILTHYHVVQNATKIYVRLPGGRGSYADIHAADVRSDLAVLKLLRPVDFLKAVPMGDADKCARGQFVLSIANPFAAGFRDGQPSASWGILSNIRRRVPGTPNELGRIKPLHHYGILLQTDARLSLGCSGGALINLQGEMIGLLTALAAIQGGETPGGFAIPIDAGMRRIIDVLKRGEEVDYGFLGVSFNDGPQGVTLAHAIRGSPAERDGQLQANDRILEVNGKPIRESDDLFLALGTQLAGAKIKLKVLRTRGNVETKNVTLAKFLVPGKNIASSEGKRPYFRGLRVDHSSLLVQPTATQFSHIPEGVMVSEVQPNSPAAASQLRTGEVISHVQDVKISTPADFYREVARRIGPVELTLHGNEPRPKVVLGQRN
jgi:S1-C subfamily serine protease